MQQPVRVRFAPSPTGGLHIGGVRTVLYNYLFARKHGGAFVLRVEDTDRSRFVEGAEQYIIDCLEWCGLQPDESPQQGGAFAPYRQSERKEGYRKYAAQLIASDNAYYAFDTTEELDRMRHDLKTEENPSPQYGHTTRMQMRNSLSLSGEETDKLLAANTPYVIRIKMPVDETVSFTDMIRGEVSFDTALVDDKVLLKADGMPTYHLAVVADDHDMQITHAFRGEEWLPSAPVHLLLWKYLGWEKEMPQWAHFPLILGSDGSKLSKRHGNKYGFPIFAMNWTDPVKNEFTEGFRERGFLPEAFINLLAMLGWNDGSGQELFTREELIEKFDISRVAKSGAAFDFDKAKWFNHQYIQQLSAEKLVPLLKPYLATAGIRADDDYIQKVIGLVKERITLLPDFIEQSAFFFKAPQEIDTASIKAKWSEKTAAYFSALITAWSSIDSWGHDALEGSFNDLVAAQGIKKGEVMLPLRIMLVGGKFGPGVIDIASVIGKEQTIQRLKSALEQLV